MTSIKTDKNLEKLFDLKSELSNIKTDFKDNLLSKSRLGSLVITKLEEVKHWLNDLIDEAIEEEGKKDTSA
ncbi:hypothetical protein EKK58_12080 [Candidatus Dependentiae bacterium]|nr:MAG: hypothetical protein EKK58_12080 [Candidatus Dependentiae bacterium]